MNDYEKIVEEQYGARMCSEKSDQQPSVETIFGGKPKYPFPFPKLIKDAILRNYCGTPQTLITKPTESKTEITKAMIHELYHWGEMHNYMIAMSPWERMYNGKLYYSIEFHFRRL